MEWISAIHEAIAYMEEHLLEEINYEDVAESVHISSYEFHRAFSFLSGMTANAYIRNRRLSLAGTEVVGSDAKITDIALKYGYDTPESFTKAFTRFHGVAPKTARETNAKLVLFNPIAIKVTMEGGMSMDYRIVQTQAQKFIALVRNFRNEIINEEDNHDIPDFWDECYEKDLVEPIRELRPEGKRDLYGLCTPAVQGADTFAYGIGVLVDKDTAPFDEAGMLQKGYRIWDVKPGTYAVFDCMGEDADCISEKWSRFYKEFLPRTGYASSDATDYEVYFENGKEGLFCELWIPVEKR